jgi:hypothetical protein
MNKFFNKLRIILFSLIILSIASETINLEALFDYQTKNKFVLHKCVQRPVPFELFEVFNEFTQDEEEHPFLLRLQKNQTTALYNSSPVLTITIQLQDFHSRCCIQNIELLVLASNNHRAPPQG